MNCFLIKWVIFGVLWGMAWVTYSFAFEMKVGFVDRVSGEPTLFTNPNGVSLKIEFLPGAPSEIDSEKDLIFDVEWKQAPEAPGTEISAPAVMPALHEAYSLTANEVAIQKSFRLSLPKRGRIGMWAVRVDARQGSQSREAFAQVYAVGMGFDFYRMRSAPICYWASPFRVTSAYRFNESASPMQVNRTLQTVYESGFGSDFMPVYFRGKGQDRYLNSWMQVERNWVLNPSQGGFFAERSFFTRTLADHFVWQNGSYENVESGYLDVGRTVTDFYLVPKSAASDPETVASFLNEFIPSPKPCGFGTGGTPVPSQVTADTEFLFTPESPDPKP